ncbi:MAG: nucleoside recognition protein [Verrucomicrobiae bacterium]|nr:nucleoside recognition protein [Verrucomicrobiae bacterium]
MLNWIWLGLVLAAVLIGGFHTAVGDPQGGLQAVTDGAFTWAKKSVMELALPLAGMFVLWLGLMRLAEKCGAIQALARWLRPALRRLFPDVPPDHPAMGAIVMTMAANMLGLGNAATPLGLKAMKDLERLNPRPGTASNAMCTFLAISTSSIQLIPFTAVGILSVNGSKEPYAIIGTALLSTVVAFACAILAVKTLEKLPFFKLEPIPVSEAPAASAPASDEALLPDTAPLTPLNGTRKLLLGGLCLCFLLFLGFAVWNLYTDAPTTQISTAKAFALAFVKAISLLAVPFVLAFFPLYASLRGVKVYEEFIEGAKEGFQVAVRIIPYLVGILVAVGMLRDSGGIALFTEWVRPFLEWIHFPPDLLPMALMRPLSGSGTQALFMELVKNFGPDHLISRMAGTIYGSTETTFYVLAIYFGSVGVKRTRHAIPAGLTADIVAVIASVIICRVVFG